MNHNGMKVREKDETDRHTTVALRLPVSVTSWSVLNLPSSWQLEAASLYQRTARPTPVRTVSRCGGFL